VSCMKVVDTDDDMLVVTTTTCVLVPVNCVTTFAPESSGRSGRSVGLGTMTVPLMEDVVDKP